MSLPACAVRHNGKLAEVIKPEIKGWLAVRLHDGLVMLVTPDQLTQVSPTVGALRTIPTLAFPGRLGASLTEAVPAVFAGDRWWIAQPGRQAQRKLYTP